MSIKDDPKYYQSNENADNGHFASMNPQHRRFVIHFIKWAVIFAIIFIVYEWQKDTINEAIIEIEQVELWRKIICMVFALGFYIFEGAIIKTMTLAASGTAGNRITSGKMAHTAAGTAGNRRISGYVSPASFGKRNDPGSRTKVNFSLFDGFLGALFCHFYKLITLGSGEGIAEIYYLNGHGILVSEATGMTLVQYTFFKIIVGAMGILSFMTLFLTGQGNIGEYWSFLLAGAIVVALVAAILIILSVSKRAACLLVMLVRRIVKKKSLRYKWTNGIIRFNKSGRNIWSSKRIVVRVLILNICKLSCWYMLPAVLTFGDSEILEAIDIAGPLPGKVLVFIDVFLMMSVVNMISGIMIAPAGIGTLEFSFAMIFSAIMTTSRAVGIVILYRFFTWILPFILGALVAGFYRHQ